MKTAVRIYKNADGELVGEGDTSAIVLAYGLDDEIEPADESAAKKLQPKGKAAEKADEPSEQEKAEKVIGETTAKTTGDPVGEPVSAASGDGDASGPKPAKGNSRTVSRSSRTKPAK